MTKIDENNCKLYYGVWIFLFHPMDKAAPTVQKDDYLAAVVGIVYVVATTTFLTSPLCADTTFTF